VIRRVVTASLVLLLCGCAKGPEVMIVNGSASTLEQMVLTGSGFSEDLGSSAPGSRRKITVDLRSNSGMRLEFDVAGRHFESNNHWIFQSGKGHLVIFRVEKDFTISTRLVPHGF
jgi:hypothetical protein